MADKEIRTQIHSLQRLNNSVNGNPRYRVTFTDGGTADTQSDASINYGIGNPEYRDVPVIVSLSKAGRITHVRVADPE